MEKTRVAVIGTGYLGALHAKLYQEIESCHLAAICDSDPKRLAEVSHQLNVAGVTDHRQLYGKIDAVSIAVPTSAHYAVCQDMLKQGIHCLVEKPFTSTLKEADGLIKRARRHRRILQVGHIERFNSAFGACQKLFKNPFFIECHRLSAFPNRSLDVGVVLDLMIHDIDIVMGLVQSRIKRIESVGVNVLTPYEDIANARISFANGCVANLTASRISDEPMRKIRMFLKDAYISLDYKHEQAFVYTRSSAGIEKHALPIEKEQPLKKELAAFIHCVRHNEIPLVSGPVARQALAVALHIRDQIWKKRKAF